LTRLNYHRDANFKNTLVRDHGIDAGSAGEGIASFRSDGKFVGLIRFVGGADRVDIATAEASANVDADEEMGEEVVEGSVDSRVGVVERKPGTGEPIQSPPRFPTLTPKAIFIGHGHDVEALDALVKLLKEMRIEHRVVKDEAHAGRPISQKVADAMQECSAGIFIASADDDGLDDKGSPTRVARQNVIYELGAASLLYGQRIVIFKEKGVFFPSDFRDLGYIEYERGHLSDKYGSKSVFPRVNRALC
jgi:predicted nucleotide-binding protein